MPKALVSTPQDMRTGAEKRRDTLANKKSQEEAQLRQANSSEKVPRAAKVAALKNAGWRGAAPTGSHKRARSPSAQLEASDAKKARVVAGVRKQSLQVKKRAIPASTSKTPKSAKHRRLPTVMSDDDQDSVVPDDDQDSEAPSLATTGRHRRRHSQVSHDDDNEGYTADEGDNDDDDEEPIDNSLQKLGAKELKHTLHNERAQWNGTEDKSASDSDLVADEDMEADNESKGNSKRASDRLAEAPRWRNEVAQIKLSESDEGSDQEVRAHRNQRRHRSEDVNYGWSPEARYEPARAGARMICIRSQPANLRHIIKAAIRTITGDAMADDAYPPAETIHVYYRKVLVRCADELELSEYVNRFKTDSDFGNAIGRLLNGRLSLYRGIVKKVAAGKVEGFYTLLQGPGCKTKIDSLLHNTSYIYERRSETGLIVRTKPFKHPAVISILREAFFNGSRGSLAEKHKDRFVSIMEEGPAAVEPEIPAAMLALVATCIHSALDDFSNGNRQKTDFIADLYEDIYKGHIEFLNDIREASGSKYHRLMADIYSEVSLSGNQRTTTVSNSAKQLLDIAGMDET